MYFQENLKNMVSLESHYKRFSEKSIPQNSEKSFSKTTKSVEHEATFMTTRNP